MLLSVKPLHGEVFTLDIDDETTVDQVRLKIHDMAEYRNMSPVDLKIANMNGKGWGITEHDLKISVNLREKNKIRLFTHHLEQKGFVKGYEAALKDIASDKDIGSDKDFDKDNPDFSSKYDLMHTIGVFEEEGLKLKWEVRDDDVDCFNYNRLVGLHITLEEPEKDMVGDKNESKNTGSSKDKGDESDSNDEGKDPLRNFLQEMKEVDEQAARKRGMSVEEMKKEKAEHAARTRLEAPIYVISVDTEEGNKRKNQLNFPHLQFKGYTHEATEKDIIKMKGRGQETTGTKPRQQATFYSHYMLWKHIADDESIRGAVICEDDALRCDRGSLAGSRLRQILSDPRKSWTTTASHCSEAASELQALGFARRASSSRT